MTQTTLYFFSKRILSVFITVLIVSSCATPKKVSKSTQPVTVNKTSEVTEQTVAASDYLHQAEKASPQAAIALMLKAANTYNTEKNPVKSLWLAGELHKLPLSESQNFETILVKTESLLALNKLKDAEEQLLLANKLIDDNQISANYQYYRLASVIEKNKNNPIRSNSAALLAFSLNNNVVTDDIMNLWSNLSTLSSWELQKLKKQQLPYFDGWLDLITKANKWGDNKFIFDQQIIKFQSQFPNHPANFIAEQLQLVSEIEAPLIKNIAVLLPLSGQHKSIGEIVQQGVLAAYTNNDISLTFVDTNKLDFTRLGLRFIDEEIDHVIGPLLKPNVDQYIAQADISLPSLLLNIPTLDILGVNHFAFSMKREDEAIQAATVLSNKHYKHPVLFSTQDNVSRKIASSFANKWQSLTGTMLEVVILEANENMQKSLKISLDVDVSKARIRNLEAQIRQKIETENRNRRDIDMIFIAAPTTHTRLIKPFIDVNTSTYSNTIPMYASSLSYDGSNDDAEIRDLTGLTFSEIPWLLDSQWQNKAASKTSQNLWPNRSESLQRIYALGYDSLLVISKLEQLKKLPYLRHYGQTGELKMGADNIISRSLLWGQYTNGTVKEVDME